MSTTPDEVCAHAGETRMQERVSTLTLPKPRSRIHVLPQRSHAFKGS